MKINSDRAKNRQGSTWVELFVIVGLVVLLGVLAGVSYQRHLEDLERSKAWNEAKTQEGIAETGRIQKAGIRAEGRGKPGVIPIPMLLPVPF